MKILTTFCKGDAVSTLERCLPDEEIRCADDASETFISEAEVLIFLHWRNARKIVGKMKNLKMLQALTAGVDHIPREEIPSRTILCSNSGSNAWAVAEHALALILSALKRIPSRDREMRRGGFPQMLESELLRGKKVAIVGFGNIGQNLARMLSPFGVEIYAINRRGRYDGDIPVNFVGKAKDLNSILPLVDILVLTLPLTEDTEGLINMEKLERMKKDAILVNVARGRIVVEHDLYEFLIKNPEFTACLDVWWHYGSEFRQNYPFEELENIIMTPHCGGVYREWEKDAMEHACENVRRFIRGEEVKNRVYP